MKILITGASGYIGSQLLRYLAEKHGEDTVLMGTDINPFPGKIPSSVTFIKMDICTDELKILLDGFQPDVIVHLAAIVMPSKRVSRERMYEIDVEGTERLLKYSLNNGLRRIITTSSGAAYGYHADNPDWLRETDPLRGNHVFAYAWHKKLVEELLAAYRISHPQLEQTIFRVGTILGKNTRNHISELFSKAKILTLKGVESPFVIIWDQDLVRLLAESCFSPKTGIYNVAGDGSLTLDEIAELQGKKTRSISPCLARFGIWIGHKFGLLPYGPEQLKFIQFRPVLSNQKLKEEFGFVPEMTSKGAFLKWVEGGGN